MCIRDRYFAKDSDDDSDMHESDEEFVEAKPKQKKRRRVA